MLAFNWKIEKALAYFFPRRLHRPRTIQNTNYLSYHGPFPRHLKTCIISEKLPRTLWWRAPPPHPPLFLSDCGRGWFFHPLVAASRSQHRKFKDVLGERRRQALKAPRRSLPYAAEWGAIIHHARARLIFYSFNDAKASHTSPAAANQVQEFPLSLSLSTAAASNETRVELFLWKNSARLKQIRR